MAAPSQTEITDLKLHGMRIQRDTTSSGSRPRVIASENNTTKRKIKEALAINKQEKERGNDKGMNQDKGTELSKIWLNPV